MPNYEYRREDGSTFTIFQRFEEEPLHVCPETGQLVKRIISGGNGPLLPKQRTVKYTDGRFINSPRAKALEANAMYTSFESKRTMLNKIKDRDKLHETEKRMKLTGRITASELRYFG